MVWAALAIGALLLPLLITTAPLAKANGFVALSIPIYQAFSHLCHQLPERSFFLAGHPLAVCARCTGAYFGFAAAVLGYPLITSLKSRHVPETKWLFIAAVPLAIDFGLTWTGIWENTHWSRFATGALLGGVAVFFVMPALAELSLRLKSSRATTEVNQRAANVPNISNQGFADALSDYSAPHRRI